MTESVLVQIRLRRGTAASWTSNDPVLGPGEEGYETDTGRRKVGDGVTAWTSLAYDGGAGSGDVTGPSSAVDERIAVFNGTTGKLIKDGGATVGDLATDAELSAAIAAHVAASDPHPNYALESSLGTAAAADAGDFEATGAVATHAAVTSGVHGISAFGATLLDDANASAARTTLELGTAATTASTDYATAAQGALADTATQPADLASAISDHSAATDPHGDRAYADGLASNYATAAQGATADTAVQPGDLGTVATSNSYDDLDDLPTLGSAAATDSGDYATAAQGALADSAAQPADVSSAVSTHAALTETHGISAFGATLVDDADAATARTTLGLGTAATTAASAYATAAQGTTADSALQPSDIASGTITARADDIDLSGGSDGDVLTVQADGSLALETPIGGGGSSNTRWIGAGELIPRVTNGAGIDGEELATNDINLDYLAFDTATSEGAQASFAWPSGFATFTATFHWTAASGSGGVRWQCSGRCYADDAALDQAQGTAQAVSDTFLLANDAHKSSATSAITPAGTVAAGNLCVVEVTRAVAHVDDTLAVDARLIGVLLEFSA